MKQKLGLAFMLLFLAAGQSDAYERRHSPFFCFSGSDDRGETDFDGTSKGIRNRSSGAQWKTVKLICPVMVDDDLPLRNIKTLTIQGYDGDSGGRGLVGARACVTYRWAVGGDCGAAVTTGFPDFTGIFQLFFTLTTSDNPLEKWQTLNVDYPYVEITLPGEGPAGFSSIFGYVITD